MKGRILQVSTADRGGGAEAVAVALHRALRARGRPATLVVGRRLAQEPGVEPLRQGARPTWRLRDRLERQRKVRRAIAAHALAEPGLLLDLVRGHEDFRYPGSHRIVELHADTALLHLHNLHGRYFDPRALPRLTRACPTLLTLHDEWTFTGHCAATLECERWRTGCGACPHLDTTPRLLRDGTAWNWRRKESIWRGVRLTVVAPSRWLLERAADSILAPAIADMQLIPNGVDLQRFAPGSRDAARAELGLEPDTAVIAFIAQKSRTNPLKDFGILRSALDLLGRSSGERIVALALGSAGPPETLGRVTVRFPGQVPHAAVPTFLRAADLYVHPARWENHPLAVLEALACGRPVVASRVGGLPEQVRTEDEAGDQATGALVRPRDAGELAATIARLLAAPETLSRMGGAARRDAEARFGLDGQVQAYLRLYDALLEEAS